MMRKRNTLDRLVLVEIKAATDSHHSNGVVIEYCRYIFGREFVGRIADQKAGLAYRTVSDDDAPVEQWKALA